MLDDTPSKRRVGALISHVHTAWQDDVRQSLGRRQSPVLGASAELLAQISLAGISQSLLAERIGLTKQAVQQGLDQLESAGLVRRDPDPVDRRAKYVVLTEAGLYALEARREAEKEVERLWRDRLGKKGLNRLRKALEAILETPSAS